MCPSTADRSLVVPTPLLPLLITLLLAGLARAQGEDPAASPGEALGAPPVQEPEDGPAGRPQEPQEDPAEDPEDRLAGWRFALERDAGLAFPASNPAALDAVVAEPGPVTDAARPAALLALGASQEPQAGQLLAGWADEGQGESRLAAILALGELGTRLGDRSKLLVELLVHEVPAVRECALLALLRSGQDGWRELAAGLAADPAHPLHGDAPSLILAVEAPEDVDAPPRAALRLLGLRWEAAQRFGSINGRSWGATVLERLGENDRFLTDVVLGATSDVKLTGVADHVLALLLVPGSPERVRTAVRVMPRELDQLMAAGLWAPSNPAEWRTLLDEALRQGLTPLLPAALEQALEQPQVAPGAAALLVRRSPAYEEVVLEALRSPDVRRRILACRGLGEAGHTRLLPELQALDADRNLAVRAAALVARLQLLDPVAYETTRAILTEQDPEGLRWRALLRDALAEAGRSGDLTTLLADLAGEVEGPEGADLQAICALRGRVIDGAALREAFDLVPPGTPVSVRMIEALASLPTAEDLQFLADRFPMEGEARLNVALARALIQGGHKKVEPILRRAVWRGPFERSVLAAAVVKQTSGLRALQHWVLKPPPTASDADVRRVGYAIGAWGGVSAIQELQERLGGVAGADRPALQGAFLGAMAARTH